MSATTTSNGKGGKATAAESKYDVDNLIPLIFATLGNPTINYKIMAALDPHGRTEAAFQHRFRTWRKEGLALADANPEMAIPTASAPAKKRTPAAKKDANGNGKGKAKQSDVGDEEDEAEDVTEASGIKKEEDDMVGHTAVIHRSFANRIEAGVEMSLPATNGTNGANKRVTSNDAETIDEDDETPAKKAKVTKKGTATVVKKRGAKARESLETGGDEEDEAETPSKAKAKAKPARKPAAKGRGKAAAAAKDVENLKSISKWKGETMAQEGKMALKEEEDGIDAGLIGEDVFNHNGLIGKVEDSKVEMQFEIESAV